MPKFHLVLDTSAGPTERRIEADEFAIYGEGSSGNPAAVYRFKRGGAVVGSFPVDRVIAIMDETAVVR